MASARSGRQAERLQRHPEPLEDLEVRHVRRRPDQPEEGVGSDRQRDRQAARPPAARRRPPSGGWGRTGAAALPTLAAKVVSSSVNGTGSGWAMPTGRAGTSLGPGERDHCGGEIVFGHGELTRRRARSREPPGARPAGAACPAMPPHCGPYTKPGRTTHTPASPCRHLRRQLGPAVELAGPRIGRHRRQRDRPPHPAGDGLVEQRHGAEDVRLPDLGPPGQPVMS